MNLSSRGILFLLKSGSQKMDSGIGSADVGLVQTPLFPDLRTIVIEIGNCSVSVFHRNIPSAYTDLRCSIGQATEQASFHRSNSA